MQAQTMRVYQITFIERYQPVSGWLSVAPEDITDKVNREAEDTGSYQQR